MITSSADPRRPGAQARRICLVGLIAGGHAGVPRYAARLAQAIDEVGAEYPGLDITLLTTEAGAEAAGVRRIAVRIAAGRRSAVNAGPGRLLLEQVHAARAAADVLHFFDLSGPVIAPRRAFVTTIHDASVMRGFRSLRNSYKRRLYPWALRHATAAVAVSQFAKDEALAYFDVDPERIAVIHSGPGFVSNHAAAPSTAGSPRGPYLLYVGNLGVNKNLPLLVRAFHRAEVDARLILAGRPRDGFREVRAAIEAGPRRDSIEVLPQASDEEVEDLYRGAVALALPSSYEGFGFTPLEAMTRGCAVVASDIPAVREVSGDGALLVPHDDETAWADAIRRLVDDERLREELRARGAVTAERYSWSATARGVLELIASLPLG